MFPLLLIPIIKDKLGPCTNLHRGRPGARVGRRLAAPGSFPGLLLAKANFNKIAIQCGHDGRSNKYFCCMRLLGFLFILPLTTFSQNLIPNGGFEDENICTEYSKNCAPEAWIATSLRANYYFDDQPNAHGGSHFVGLIIGNISRAGYRSFVRTQLLCRPKKGHEYTLDFFIRSDHPALDSIGIYFSATDFLFDRRNFKQITPQLWSKQGIEFSGFNPGKWYHVDLEYTASGDEQYLTIGNFKKNEYSGFGQAEYEDNYYFFLDDVSLIPKDPREHLCPECDSIKNVIYAQNDRHQLLERKIYLMRKN